MARKPADQTVNRDEILLAAAEVFQERGYLGATMADIAAKVALTAGSLYHHFPAGKSDLLLAVLNAGIDAVLRQADNIIAASDPPDEMLRRLIETHIIGITDNVAIGTAMVFDLHAVLDLTDNPEGRDAFLRRRDEFEKRYRLVVEAGIAARLFRQVDTPIFTKALLGADNWVSVWYRPGGRLTGKEIAERIADIFLTALRC